MLSCGWYSYGLLVQVELPELKAWIFMKTRHSFATLFSNGTAVLRNYSNLTEHENCNENHRKWIQDFVSSITIPFTNVKFLYSIPPAKIFLRNRTKRSSFYLLMVLLYQSIWEKRFCFYQWVQGQADMLKRLFSNLVLQTKAYYKMHESLSDCFQKTRNKIAITLLLDLHVCKEFFLLLNTSIYAFLFGKKNTA